MKFLHEYTVFTRFVYKKRGPIWVPADAVYRTDYRLPFSLGMN